jgi:drug/metabolite transporter (DMT)-like permease
MTAVLTWVGYLLTSKRARAHLSTAEFMGTVSVVATLALLPLALARGGLFDMTAKGWVLIVVLAVLTGTAAHGLLVWAQRHVPVSTISVLSLAQPALATLWAFLVLGEGVRPLQVVGGSIVLASLLLFTREVNRR